MDHRVSIWYNPEQYNFITRNTMKCHMMFQKVQNILKLIPENVKVSATNCLVLQISFQRLYIYSFPVINDVNLHIVILRSVINFFHLTKKNLKKN